MGLLRRLFGPSKEAIWKQLSEQIGADFQEGKLLEKTKVVGRTKEWTITLDAEVVPAGKVMLVFTRLRAPYVNRDGFRFRIYRKGLFSGVAKVLGKQDIEIGEPAFDDAFIIQGNNEAAVRRLLANVRIRSLIEAQPRIELEVRDDEGWFGTEFPEGVDELRFKALGIITDLEQLRMLYELFAELLDHLCRIGSAYEDDPKVVL